MGNAGKTDTRDMSRCCINTCSLFKGVDPVLSTGYRPFRSQIALAALLLNSRAVEGGKEGDSNLRTCALTE